MTPFQAFRDWTRHGRVEERVFTLLAAVIAAAVFAWLLAPGGSGPGAALDASAIGATGAANAPTPTATTIAGGAAPAPTGSGVAAAPGTPTGSANPSGTNSAAPTPAPTGKTGCVSPPGADGGVSATAIKLAVTLVNLAGAAANNTFGLPSVQEQQDDYQQVADAINASGGVACRKLQLQFYAANPLDQSDLQQKCLDIADAGMFALLDAGAYYTNPEIAACYPTNHIPFFSAGPQTNSAMQKFFPYLFAQSSTDLVLHNTVFALRDRGFFDPAKGFGKLGFLHRNCTPVISSNFRTWLRQAGVADAQIVDYEFGCPSGGFSSPADIAQAILKFQQNGVTHVTFADFGADFSNFTTIAQQQRFNPKYGIGEDAVVATTYSNTHPDYNNIADALAITPSQYGQEHTPGLAPSPATAKCNGIYVAHGRGADVVHQSSAFGGAVCNQLWIAAAAIGHAPSMQRSALSAGLQAAKSVEVSYPGGPNNFSTPRVTYGGQFWRPLQFLADCTCWRVVDPAFHPSY